MDPRDRGPVHVGVRVAYPISLKLRISFRQKAILIWEEVMPTLAGFNTFAALPEEQISEKISRRTRR
jgi:hypothetical protein